jgi:hypothetical protein
MASSSSLSGTFKFVLIPSDDKLPIQEIELSKDGGLTADNLIKHARAYFGADEVCDIAALTIPIPTNNYTAVSLYHVGGGGGGNKRATELVVGCGMNMTISGDVFVGRCIDNEVGDVWERIDFLTPDVDPSVAWCQQARASTGGSRHTPSSLSGILQQQINPTTIQAPPSTNDAFGQNGDVVKEDWGTWSQTADEVEIKFVVQESTKGKDVKVLFGRSKLSVKVHGEELVSGSTFNPVIADESTYTIQTEGNTRELCVTLAKEKTGTTWSYTVKK